MSVSQRMWNIIAVKTCFCSTFQTMAEGVEIRKGKGKLKRLDTDEVAEKLTPDEVEDFRDAFKVSWPDHFRIKVIP